MIIYFSISYPFNLFLMMLFQPELGLSMLELLGRLAVSGRWLFCRNKKQKGSTGACPLPLRCLSHFFPVGEKINYLGNEVLCISLCTFHRWGGLVFIMGDHDKFPSWMITLNSIFPYWRMIRYSSHLVGDFLSFS